MEQSNLITFSKTIKKVFSKKRLHKLGKHIGLSKHERKITPERFGYQCCNSLDLIWHKIHTRAKSNMNKGNESFSGTIVPSKGKHHSDFMPPKRGCGKAREADLDSLDTGERGGRIKASSFLNKLSHGSVNYDECIR